MDLIFLTYRNDLGLSYLKRAQKKELPKFSVTRFGTNQTRFHIFNIFLFLCQAKFLRFSEKVHKSLITTIMSRLHRLQGIETKRRISGIIF